MSSLWTVVTFPDEKISCFGAIQYSWLFPMSITMTVIGKLQTSGVPEHRHRLLSPRSLSFSR
jgi:hypothetical protein